MKVKKNKDLKISILKMLFQVIFQKILKTIKKNLFTK